MNTSTETELTDFEIFFLILCHKLKHYGLNDRQIRYLPIFKKEMDDTDHWETFLWNLSELEISRNPLEELDFIHKLGRVSLKSKHLLNISRDCNGFFDEIYLGGRPYMSLKSVIRRDIRNSFIPKITFSNITWIYFIESACSERTTCGNYDFITDFCSQVIVV